MKANYLIWILFLVAFAAVAQPVITVQPTNQTVVDGSNANFCVSVSGTGPFTYQWQFNGTNLPKVGIITTVAGDGTNAFSGDGGAAISAELNYPSGVAINAEGNLFIADSNNGRLRRVDTNGIMTTVAGNGTFSFSGDGGAATNAGLGASGVTVDVGGNLFIADLGNNRIRKVTTNGIIMTVAGNGTNSFFATGVISTNSYSGDGGAATNAALNSPTDVAVDAGGNLFIADSRNNRIRMVALNGIITTVAGNGTQSYSGDGGTATNAALNSPNGIAMDANGNLLIADTGNNRIRKVDINGIITTLAGNGTNGYSGDGSAATNAEILHPSGVAVDTAGNVFIADTYNERIRKLDANGIIMTVAGNGNYNYLNLSDDGEAATNAALASPWNLAVDAGGDLFIADYGNNYSGSRISKVTITPNSPTLIITNVSPGNAGNYSVIITGSSGSVTSSVVTLTVVILPSFLTAPTMLPNGQFRFSVDTEIGVNYTVQYSTNLMQWFPWVTLGGIGVPLNLVDPNTAGCQQRFYRIMSSPQ